MDGRNSRGGRRRAADERRRDGGADFRKGRPRSLFGLRGKRARQRAIRTRSALPAFSLARTKLRRFGNVPWNADRARTNRIASPRVSGKTAYHSANREKRRLHFQKPGQLPGW